MSAAQPQGKAGPLQGRSSFLTRVATDDAAQLGRQPAAIYRRAKGPLPGSPKGGAQEESRRSAHDGPRTSATRRRLLGWRADSEHGSSRSGPPSLSSPRSERQPLLGEGAHSTYAASEDSTSRYRRDATRYEREKPPAETPEGDDKLGTFSGVFVPTTLNVLSILMFLRFGFILGQGGVLGMTGGLSLLAPEIPHLRVATDADEMPAMLVICYLINLVTTLSISAIATNGTVRGGGAYYLISRSLGPEFGGSIGVVFYLGFVLNTGMNAVGLVDCFVQSFGTESGNMQNWLPEGVLWSYLWATAILLLCTIICLAGSGVFARASNGLLVLLLLSILSIPLSALLQSPFANRKSGVDFTGPSLETMRSNIMPRFTRGAAGSEIDGKESFQDLFGILFPATGGIFA